MISNKKISRWIKIVPTLVAILGIGAVGCKMTRTKIVKVVEFTPATWDGACGSAGQPGEPISVTTNTNIQSGSAPLFLTTLSADDITLYNYNLSYLGSNPSSSESCAFGPGVMGYQTLADCQNSDVAIQIGVYTLSLNATASNLGAVVCMGDIAYYNLYSPSPSASCFTAITVYSNVNGIPLSAATPEACSLPLSDIQSSEITSACIPCS